MSAPYLLGAAGCRVVLLLDDVQVWFANAAVTGVAFPGTASTSSPGISGAVEIHGLPVALAFAQFPSASLLVVVP